MIRTVSFAAIALALGVSAAQACQSVCGAPPPVVVAQPVIEVERVVLPPHYIVEHGPVYDGLGVVAKPRVFKPRHATFAPRYVYGYGVAYSGGPVVLASYPYVRRHFRPRPLRVYY
jgi:hypothetical protein